MATLNVTVNGFSADLPVDLQLEIPLEDIKRIAYEVIQAGDFPRQAFGGLRAGERQLLRVGVLRGRGVQLLPPSRRDVRAVQADGRELPRQRGLAVPELDRLHGGATRRVHEDAVLQGARVGVLQEQAHRLRAVPQTPHTRAVRRHGPVAVPGELDAVLESQRGVHDVQVLQPRADAVVAAAKTRVA